MKKNKALLIIFLVALFSSLATYGVYIYLQPVKSMSYDMHAKAADYYGFNAATDKIYFGTLPNNTYGRRELVVSNEFPFRTRVQIMTSGDLAKFVTVSKNNFLLEPHTNSSVIFFAAFPTGIAIGNYTGKAVINFYRQQ